MRKRQSPARIRELIEDDKISTLDEIFDKWAYPVTNLARGIRKNTARTGYLLDHPEEFCLREIMMIARHFGVATKIITIIIERSLKHSEEDILQEYYKKVGAQQRAKAMKVIADENRQDHG